MRNRLFIKICGMTKTEDVHYALDAGVDAVGFIGYAKSPRFIDPEGVKRICSTINCIDTAIEGADSVKKVGVFVNAEFKQIRQYIDAGIDTVQLHGDESAEFAEKCAEFAEVWKVIKPQSEGDILKFTTFPADKFLLDTFDKNLYGGTGITMNYKIAKFAVDHLPKPVIMAGGISPDNSVEIIDTVHPYGLDINSGVESAPGIKDYSLIERLFVAISERA